MPFTSITTSGRTNSWRNCCAPRRFAGEAGRDRQFLFVRYRLGGPHIRLRVRLRGDGEAVVAVVQEAAERFFDAFPSRATLPEDKILAINREILKGDPTERDEAVYPDNFMRPAPFHPELERYGGPKLSRSPWRSLPYQAAVFCAGCTRRLVPGSRLSFAFHLLALQALGSARDGQELLGLIRYPVPS